MHVGAIVTVPVGFHTQANGERQAGLNSPQPNGVLPNKSPIASWEVLGQSVLDRVSERLRAFGVSEICVISEELAGTGDACSGFWPQWESAVYRYLNYALEVLLLVRVGPYVELDVVELIRFHREAASPMTQVYDQHGALDLVAVEASRLREGTGSVRNRLRNILPTQRRYTFAGYTNRLKNAHDFRQLAKDGLSGRAAIRPIGRELGANIWVGEHAQVHSSVRITGPAYIGGRSRLRAGVTISGSSAVESDCEIDCGTLVDDSCVLPGTYLGVGLKLRNAVVSERTLFNLRRNVQMQFDDRRLIGSIVPAKRLLQNARSFFSPNNAVMGSALSTKQ